MIRNYILIAWRSLLKNRLFSVINIFGLALSMSVCMMVLVRVIDNFSYDTFHPDAKNTYRILSALTMRNGNRFNLATTPLPLKENLGQHDAIVKHVISLYPALNGNATDGVKELPIYGAFTQPDFFNVFGFTLKFGDARTALVQPGSIILSELTARRFFGDINPVGKVLTFSKLGDFQVTGVIQTPPAKSHLDFEAYASHSSLQQLEKTKLPALQDNWDTVEKAYTYVTIQENTTEHALIHKLEAISAVLNKQSEQVQFVFNAQPINSITPGWTELYHETSRGGSWSKLLAEAGIALIILLAASFNYTNLSVARALTRSKEVGIRKLSGAIRWQIFAQYIIEAVIISLFALCMAQVILSIILEYKPFNDGYKMVPDVTLTLQVWLIFVSFAVLAGILAGIMPAWILSSFKPIQVLRGINTQKVFGSLSLRKSLMVFQFALSIVVIIFLTVFYKQFNYMGTANTGFATSNIIIIPFTGDPQVIAAEISRISGVKSIGFTSSHLGQRTPENVMLFERKDLASYHQFGQYFADSALINIMDLELAAGENLGASEKNERYILINEKAARSLGFQNPPDAVGHHYFLQDSTLLEVRGVIKDFYHRSVGHTIEPLVFRNVPQQFREMVILAEPGVREHLASRIESAWKKVYPDSTFESAWFDKKIKEMNDQTAGMSLLGFLAFMTIAIATMGLLGLVVYTVETRRKEISIRKIIGASATQIMTLLSAGYIKLLLISGLIAIPVGYLLSSFFLINFVNRIALGVTPLLSGFALLLVVGLITILSQTFHASMENPSKNLRNE